MVYKVKKDLIHEREKYKHKIYGIKYNFSKLQIGDHIYTFQMVPIVYEHHGIYVGDNKVLHFSYKIIESSLKDFAFN
jgi:acetyltransferase-like isoleucine patch superfamily enzyme